MDEANEEYEERMAARHEALVRDAARYRWLRNFADSYTWDYLGGLGADRVDAAIDAAMAKESGR